MDEYQKECDEKEERRTEFVRHRDGVQALYTSLGYSRSFDKYSQEIIFNLKALITAKITDIEGFTKYRDNLIDKKRKYILNPDDDSEYGFLSAADYDYIKKLENAGKDNPEEYVKIICDPNEYYACFIQYDYEGIVYKYKDINKARILLDELIDLYKRTYINAKRDRDSIIETINNFQNAIVDEYNEYREIFIDELESIRNDSIFSDESGWEKKDELDDIISFSLETYPVFKSTNSYYMDDIDTEIVCEVNRYIKLEWMHCNVITNLFILLLIDMQLLSLKIKQEQAASEDSFSFIFLLILIGLTIALLKYDYNWSSAILGGFAFLYLIFSLSSKKKYENGRTINSVKIGNLDSIRNEIESGVYNNEVISSRLKSFEGDGVYIHSHIYVCVQHHFLIQLLGSNAA